MKTIVLFDHEYDELLTVLREAGHHRETLSESSNQFAYEHGYYARTIRHLLEALNPKATTHFDLCQKKGYLVPPPVEPTTVFDFTLAEAAA